MSWICPHCATTATLQKCDVSNGTGYAAIDTADNNQIIVVTWSAIKCPSKACGKFVLDVSSCYGTALINDNDHRTGRVTPNRAKPFGLGSVRFEPRVGAPLSKNVPPVVKQDYEEACLIKDLSPKASATLCRRALQGMIRDFWLITKSSLHDELIAIQPLCDHDLFTAMMGLKGIGNIGAHPEKDINLIVDVDEGEVETLLELLRILDKEWYVARESRSSNLATVKSLAAIKAAAKTVIATASPSPPSGP